MSTKGRAGKRLTRGKKILLTVLAVVLAAVVASALLINAYLSKINYVPEDTWAHTDASSEPGDLDTAGRKHLLDSNAIRFDKDVANILLIGTDARQGDSNPRSDSMILFSINQRTKEIVATSLLRDIYLEIPGYGGNRLNAAYAFGGPFLLMDTVEKNFGVKVDQYISVDFAGFVRVIDAAGGVDIDVSEEERGVANNYIRAVNKELGSAEDDSLISSAGKQHLNGRQALGYARVRYVGNGDFDRTDRQREVLEQVLQKATHSDLGQLSALLDAALPQVTTNLSKGQVLSLILRIPTYRKYTWDSYAVPMDGAFTYTTIRGMSVLDIDFDKCTAQMQKRIYG